jgi:deoxyxylulose-5-phosphate synthase
MAFKAAFVIMAPDADPKIHRASIKMPKFELTTVVSQLKNFEQAVDVCKELVQKEGVQALILCLGFTYEAVAKVRKAVGEGIAIQVARADVPDVRMTAEMLAKEGWFPRGH